jgi:hypothetical protein
MRNLTCFTSGWLQWVTTDKGAFSHGSEPLVNSHDSGLQLTPGLSDQMTPTQYSLIIYLTCLQQVTGYLLFPITTSIVFSYLVVRATHCRYVI